MPSNTQIERIAANKVQDYIDCTDRLRSYIDVNDKTPMWDGSIFVYKGEADKNVNLKGTIKSQVKGRTVKSLQEKESFTFPMTNLQNYMRSGGVVYFVVELIKELNWSYRIFYVVLTPSILKILYNKYKGKDKVTISLLPIPENYRIFETELHDFLINSIKQQSYIDKPTLTIEDVLKSKDDTITFYSSFISDRDEGDIWNQMASRKMFLYLRTPYSDIPIEDAPVYTTVKQLVEKPVKVNERIYYSNFIQVLEYYSIKVNIDDVLTLTIPRERFKDRIKSNIEVSFPSHGLLQECIRKMTFLNEMVNVGELTLGEQTYTLFDCITDENRCFIEDVGYWYNVLIMLDETWKELHIPFELNFDEYNNEQKQQLLNLVEYVHVGKSGTPKNVNKFNNKVGFSMFSIGPLKLLLYYEKMGEDTFKWIDAFGKSIDSKGAYGEHRDIVPLFSVALRHYPNCIFDNVDYEKTMATYKECLEINNSFIRYVIEDYSILCRRINTITDSNKKQSVKDLANFLYKLMAVAN